jgi:DNA (cytosine-5)-methyltransferase 1
MPAQIVAFDTTQVTSKLNRSNPKPGDPCHPLAAGAHAPAIAFHTAGYGASEGPVSATLQASDARLSNQVHGVITAAVPRRLTPRECERLQSFPDDWTRYADDGREIADGPRYRMLGNAITVNVAEWIARRIAAIA